MTNVLEVLRVVSEFSEICVFFSRKDGEVNSESELLPWSLNIFASNLSSLHPTPKTSSLRSSLS